MAPHAVVRGVRRAGEQRTQASARDAVRTFHSEASARAWLHEQVAAHDLNPEWLGLGAWSSAEPVPPEVHEANFEVAMATWRDVASGWFIESGRTPDERGIIAVVEGHVRGYGFVEANDLNDHLRTAEGQGCLHELTQGLHPVAPSSTLDARLREEVLRNPTWVMQV